jgi:MinD superfamily P-loop ATPase
MDKHTTKDNCLGLTFCSNCATQCNTSVYKTAKSQAEEYYHKLRDQETKLKYDDLRTEQDLQKHVITNIKKYLPHFSMADRKTVRQYIKKGKTGTAIQHISCQTVAILEKSTNYKFTVTVLGGRTYLFYLMKNKLISGGIYDGRI